MALSGPGINSELDHADSLFRSSQNRNRADAFRTGPLFLHGPSGKELDRHCGKYLLYYSFRHIKRPGSGQDYRVERLKPP